MRSVAVALACTAVAACAIRPPRVAADLVITNASIWTGAPSMPSAAALAIIGERIVDVGGAEAIERWRGPDTVVVNAGGRRVVPGFNDAHTHFADGGIRLDRVDLRDADSPAEFARRINERARAKPGEWILGGEWDDRRWTPPSLPTRSLVDDATNGAAVFVRSYDGRMAFVNSTVLARAGIDEHTPDPQGGQIVRDARGWPTGVLKNAAIDLVERVSPKMSVTQRAGALKRALDLAASLGVTSVQDMNADIAAYAELEHRAELTVRIGGVLGEAGWYDQARLGIRRSFGSPWLRLGAVGGVARDDEATRTRLRAADYSGLQLCAEAEADADLPSIVNTYADIVRTNGDRDRRFRLERVRHVASADLDRVAALKIVASVEPASAAESARSLLEKGVRVAFGSNWDAGSLNPMIGLAAASTITMEQAVTAYTAGSAFAEFQDGEKGTLARGKLADLVILGDDIFTISRDRVKDVRVLTTIAGGRVVFQRRP